MLRSQVVKYFGDYVERSALSSLMGRFPRCRQQELTWIPALEPQCENPITAISPQLFLRGIIRSFDWFVSGEKNESRSPAEHPPLQNVIVRNLLPSGNRLTINERLVEATGVELISLLTLRKLLIP
jgi:hypothetical protein